MEYNVRDEKFCLSIGRGDALSGEENKEKEVG